MTIRAVIAGVGSALPARRVTNAELAETVDTTDEWIVERTGIRARYLAGDGETTATLATEAARNALAHAGIEIVGWEDLDAVDRKRMTEVFEQRIFPVLTPLAVDPSHPFPYISELALSIAAMVSDPDPERDDPARSLTGDAQERWLLDGMASSAATWQVVGQQVMFAEHDYLPGAARGFNPDAWDGYTANRQRILDLPGA